MATAVRNIKGETPHKRQTFARRLEARKKEGKCCCWDCLRSIGLTPPLGARHQHPQLHPKREVGWVEGFELKGEDRVGMPDSKRGMGILAEHKAADHILNQEYALMRQVRMV